MFVFRTCLLRTKTPIVNALCPIGTCFNHNLNGYNNFLNIHTNYFITIKNRKLLNERFRFVQTLANVKKSIVPPAQSSKKLRPPRRKMCDDEKSMYKNVLAFATADKYNMTLLKEELYNYSSYKPTTINEFKGLNLLHLKAITEDDEPKEIYVFEEGSVVFWNIPESDCQDILRFIKKFEISSYSQSIIENEKELMPYTYAETGKPSDLVTSLINLSPEKDDIKSLLDKYTFSNAMVMSVKLGVWESILECLISEIEVLTEDLKLGNKIRISSKDVLKKTGELFSLRHAVNLSSDALDTPDFYWDLETQEKIYIKMCNYFAINRRTTVVNEKISHCLELLDLLSSQLTDQHHVRLEWMIIILITVEVFIAVAFH